MSGDEDLPLLEPFDPSGYYSESRSSFGEDIALSDPFLQLSQEENHTSDQVSNKAVSFKVVYTSTLPRSQYYRF